ncbi:hypothetical protein D3C72_2047480 [compost metagenome]
MLFRPLGDSLRHPSKVLGNVIHGLARYTSQLHHRAAKALDGLLRNLTGADKRLNCLPGIPKASATERRRSCGHGANIASRDASVIAS